MFRHSFSVACDPEPSANNATTLPDFVILILWHDPHLVLGTTALTQSLLDMPEDPFVLTQESPEPAQRSRLAQQFRMRPLH